MKTVGRDQSHIMISTNFYKARLKPLFRKMSPHLSPRKLKSSRRIKGYRPPKLTICDRLLKINITGNIA